MWEPSELEGVAFYSSSWEFSYRRSCEHQKGKFRNQIVSRIFSCFIEISFLFTFHLLGKSLFFFLAFFWEQWTMICFVNLQSWMKFDTSSDLIRKWFFNISIKIRVFESRTWNRAAAIETSTAFILELEVFVL